LAYPSRRGLIAEELVVAAALAAPRDEEKILWVKHVGRPNGNRTLVLALRAILPSRPSTRNFGNYILSAGSFSSLHFRVFPSFFWAFRGNICHIVVVGQVRHNVVAFPWDLFLEEQFPFIFLDQTTIRFYPDSSEEERERVNETSKREVDFCYLMA
jgi:hypothetical protein